MLNVPNIYYSGVWVRLLLSNIRLTCARAASCTNTRMHFIFVCSGSSGMIRRTTFLSSVIRLVSGYSRKFENGLLLKIKLVRVENTLRFPFFKIPSV